MYFSSYRMRLLIYESRTLAPPVATRSTLAFFFTILMHCSTSPTFTSTEPHRRLTPQSVPLPTELTSNLCRRMLSHSNKPSCTHVPSRISRNFSLPSSDPTLTRQPATTSALLPRRSLRSNTARTSPSPATSSTKCSGARSPNNSPTASSKWYITLRPITATPALFASRSTASMGSRTLNARIGPPIAAANETSDSLTGPTPM
mmetsp:Transcript_12506/g.56886  ORF Transcript_12506/g.56886 Transcript_12506/m.56886 type:complete len:203 (-) Transcript_12506:2064-2672(-)